MRSGTQALERSLAILDLFHEGHTTLTISEVATFLGVSSVTAYRYVRAFADAGYLVIADGSVRLTPKFIRIGHLFLAEDHLVRAAERPINAVQQVTQETVALCELQGINVTCTYRVESQLPLRTSFAIGQAMPIYAGAFARVLAAFLPNATLQSIIARTRWDRFTPNTIANPINFKDRLREIQDRGHDVSSEEVDLGVFAIAVPIRAYPNLVASLGLVMPLTRYSPDRLRDYLDPLVKAQQQIESVLLQVRGSAQNPFPHTEVIP